MNKMEKQSYKIHTPEEYLVLEEAAEYKSEYYQGEIFAMSGGSVNHNRIVGNLHAGLLPKLSGSPCEAFMSDIRVWAEAKGVFTYPDIIIVCGDLQFYETRNDTITNPLIIFEVLSKSTENYDRGKKFEIYRAIPALREYILIDQYKIHIEQFAIGNEGKWVLTEYSDEDDVFQLFNADFQTPLKEIYKRVDFNLSED